MVKGVSNEEREEALNSEKLSFKLRQLSSEFGIDHLVIKEMIVKDLEKELENDENTKDDDKGRRIQSAYRFVQSLEERRQFIRERQGEIMAEIVDGMPEWKEDLVYPKLKLKY